MSVRPSRSIWSSQGADVDAPDGLAFQQLVQKLHQGQDELPEPVLDVLRIESFFKRNLRSRSLSARKTTRITSWWLNGLAR